MKRLLAVLFLAGAGLWAQQPEGRPAPGGFSSPPPPMQPDRPPMERSFRGRGRGRWWTDPSLAKQLNLSEDQQKRMDTIFQESRLKLIDLRAALQKQEVILRPLLEADQPNEGQVLAQIDKVAQARAELEKANARMLLGLRSVLTLGQWKQLQAMRLERPAPGRQQQGSRIPFRPDGRNEQ